MTDQSLFDSEQAFHTAFVSGLEQLPAENELGAFILVLANASFDPAIFQVLSPALKRQFQAWQQQFLESPAAAGNFAADDVAVFEKLRSAGFEHLQTTRTRMEGIWQLQFNQLRSFRPPRNADACFDTIKQPFNPDGFHFNRPFLQKEMLWQGEWLGRSVKLLYNKFPFAPLHGLLVLDAEQNKPQYLDENDHLFIWRWLEGLADDMPMGVAFNSLGAYSSVNHQHFQTFVSYRKLPVELGWWRHAGGNETYPLSCQRFIRSEDAWQVIERLHQANQPYNLLYRQGMMYCVVRRFQGSYAHENWTGGFAWAETMGAITLTGECDFDQLTDSMIRSEMQKLFQP